MKKKANKYYSLILLALLMFFTANSIMGNIAFGYGLGDIIYHPTLWMITLAFVISFVINRKNEKKLIVSNAIFTIPIIWIILSATIWRGVEYRWNGEIFYVPCRTEIKIESKKENNKEILTMCTMTYYSDFTGIWNGKEMEKINGEIKIPQRLKRYLDYPIENVLIQPAHFNQWENGIKIKFHRYSLDTLKINEKYRLEGEICKIVDRKPMIRARIK